MHGSELRCLLHPFLLLLVLEAPGHGYDLIERLGELGVNDVDAGHVYRVLRHLEQDGLVVSIWVMSETGPARRRYELTAKGLADLDSWVTRLSRLDQVIATCLSRWAEASKSAPAQPGPAGISGNGRGHGSGHGRADAPRPAYIPTTM